MTDQKEFLSVSDLQRLTAETESTWRKRLGRRELPFIKLGANVRIKRTDFEEWVRAHTVAAKGRVSS